MTSLDREPNRPRIGQSEWPETGLLDSPTDIVVLMDPDGIILGVNQTLSTLVGIPRTEIIGRPIWDLFPPRVSAVRRAHFERALDTGRAVRVEELRNGIWYDSVVHPVTDSEGRVVRVAVVARDITERKTMEQALRESDERLRVLFDASPVALWVEDLSEVKRELDCLSAAGVDDLRTYFTIHPDAAAGMVERVRVLDANKSALVMYQVANTAELQALFRRSLHQNNQDSCCDELVRIAHGETSFEVERERRLDLAGPAYIRLKWSAVPSHESTLSRVLVSAIDLTQRRRLEQELRCLLQRADRGQRLLLALGQAAKAAQSAHTAEEVYASIGREMAGLGLNTVIFGLTDDRTKLVVRYTSHPPALVQAADAVLGSPGLHYRFLLEPGGPIQQLMQEGGARVLADPTHAMALMLPEELRPRAGQLVSLLGADRAICAVLGSGDDAEGLLVVLGPELSDADSAAVSAFANQTAVALRNARLYDAAQRWAAQLEQRVAERSAEVIASEARYRALFDNSSEALIVLDRAGRYVDANPAACHLLGYSREELLALGVLRTAPWAQGISRERGEELIRERWDSWHRDRSVKAREWITKSGQIVPVEVRMSPLRIGGQDVVLASGRDVSDEVAAQAALRRSQEESQRSQRLLVALSQAGQAVQQARTEPQVQQTIGEEIEKLGYHSLVLSPGLDEGHLVLGYPSWRPAAIRLGERLSRLRAAGLRVPLASDGQLRQAMDSGETVFIGSTLDLVMCGFPALGRAVLDRAVTALGAQCCIFAPLTVNEKCAGLLGIFGPDLTAADLPAVTAFAGQTSSALENARLVAQLTTDRLQMEKLAGQLVSAQENERRRLSRALHDEAGQSLTALAISLELIGQDLPGGLTEIRARTDDAVVLARQTLDRIRNLAQDLRPPALDAVGLSFTLKGLCHDFGARTRLAIDYSGQDLPPLPDPVAIAVYRLLQEALTNIVRHAGARHVWVEVAHDAETLSFQVSDDGRGFDPSMLLASPGSAGGLGLLGMQERLHLLGGRLEIRSEPGKGTTLFAHIPIEQAWNEDGAQNTRAFGRRS